MKRLTILTLILFAALLSACASSNAPAAQDSATSTTPSLLVSGGEISKSYTRADLEALPASQAVFNDVTYQGVTISTLIQDAGFDPALVNAIKAVAGDGYSVNYDTKQVLVAINAPPSQIDSVARRLADIEALQKRRVGHPHRSRS